MEGKRKIFERNLIKKIYTFKTTAAEYIKMSSVENFRNIKKCNFLGKSNIFKFPVKIFAHAPEMNWIFTSAHTKRFSQRLHRPLTLGLSFYI